ncbi:MAG: helix-turn-helix domain-containing protein [Cellvibrionaceae bacterium]
MKKNPMITTKSLLDLTNEYKGWSDYRIGKELDIKSGIVSGWRTGKHIMSDDNVAKFADLLGFDTDWLLLHIHAERHLTQPFFNDLKELAEKKTPANILDRAGKVKKQPAATRD